MRILFQLAGHAAEIYQDQGKSREKNDKDDERHPYPTFFVHFIFLYFTSIDWISASSFARSGVKRLAGCWFSLVTVLAT